MKAIKTLHVGGILMLATIFSSCGHEEKENKGNNEDVTVEAVKVKEEKASTNLNLPGELEGYYETEVYPKVNSYIKKMYVDIGDKVKQGQLLVELEAPELMNEVNEAYSKYKAAEATFINTKGKYYRLVETNKTPGAVSAYDMDQAKTNLISDSLLFIAAKSKSEAMQELAGYLKITSPFDGVVTERNLAPGAFVGPSENMPVPIIKLSNESKLRLHVAVPEKQLANIHEGKDVEFSVTSYPDKKFSGMITRVSKSVNVKTRSEMVEIVVDNEDRQLMSGMYAHVNLPISRDGKSLVVPQSAVLTNMEGCFVLRSENGKVSRIDVKKGNVMDNVVEIFGKIKPYDVILKVASDELNNGDVVKTKIVKY